MIDPPGNLDVSRETLERLTVYVRLLQDWNKKINLVSPRTLPDVWQRHIRDSLQIMKFVPEGDMTWVDLGSGAGFPGLVVAIAARESRSNHQMTLVESDQRKAAFLRAVARETATALTVLDQRIESVEPLGADVLSARALAPLSQLLVYSERHLASEGTAIFPKGANAQAEITAALEQWQFDCEEHPSVTDPDAVVLKIGNIRRV